MNPLLLTALIAQTAQAPKLDPTIPDHLRPIMEKAIQAELDPKRGTGNAVEILRQERKSYKDQRSQLAIDFRIAAIVLRKRFVEVGEYPMPIRHEQALSTFSRLELSEPGLAAWIDRVVQNHEYAKKRIGKKKQRVLKAAVLTRAGLDKKRVIKPFADLVAKAGFKLKMVPAKEATIIIKASAEDAPPREKMRMVRVRLGLESIRDGKTVWKQNMFREEGAKDPNEAIDRAILWLAKVGGRDMFFRWLGEVAFHTFMEGTPFPQQGHAHGDHQEH